MIVINQFFICNTCNKNLCALCKHSHDNNHNIIDYDLKNYICNIHNKSYNSYCNKCLQNLCVLCEKEHIDHGVINDGKIVPIINDMKLNELRNAINKLKRILMI